MAKIEFENKNSGKVRFDELKTGTCFMCNGEVYIKIDPIEMDDECERIINAIFLNGGESAFFEDDTLIKADKIYHTIQLKKE